MTSISNIDRILLILRQRLSEKSGARIDSGNNKSQNSVVGARQSIGALAAIEGIDERQLRRTFIQTLLVEQLGGDLVNDAKFQQVVTQVADALEEDAVGRSLIDRLMTDLKSCA